MNFPGKFTIFPIVKIPIFTSQIDLKSQKRYCYEKECIKNFSGRRRPGFGLGRIESLKSYLFSKSFSIFGQNPK